MHEIDRKRDAKIPFVRFGLGRSLQPVNLLSGEHYENFTKFLRSSDPDPRVISSDHGRRYTDMGSRASSATAAGIRYCYGARRHYYLENTGLA